jgi:hypothetical protein
MLPDATEMLGVLAPVASLVVCQRRRGILAIYFAAGVPISWMR